MDEYGCFLIIELIEKQGCDFRNSFAYIFGSA